MLLRVGDEHSLFESKMSLQALLENRIFEVIPLSLKPNTRAGVVADIDTGFTAQRPTLKTLLFSIFSIRQKAEPPNHFRT